MSLVCKKSKPLSLPDIPISRSISNLSSPSVLFPFAAQTAGHAPLHHASLRRHYWLYA